MFADSAHAPHAVMRIDKRMTDMLPKGVLGYAMKVPALQGIRAASWPTSASRRGRRQHRAAPPLRRPRHRARARGLRHRAPALEYLRGQAVGLLGARARPGPLQGPLLRGRRQRQDRRHHRGSSGIGRAAALKIAAPAGSRSSSRARRRSSTRSRTRSRPRAAPPTSTPATCPTTTRSTSWSRQMLADHPRDRHARQQRRPLDPALVRLSYDRFHDYERTVQLNYLEPGQADARPAAAHDRAQGSGHIVNVSSIGVQTNPPRFSAYVGSKAALDALTRVVELGDDRRQRHVHDDPHAARADADDRADEDLRLVPDDLAGRGRRPDLRGDPREAEADQHAPRARSARSPTRSRRRPSTRSCTWRTRFSRSPRAAKGQKDPTEKASGEATALAYLMRGVHW